jgi:hypothetical protein
MRKRKIAVGEAAVFNEVTFNESGEREVIKEFSLDPAE